MRMISHGAPAVGAILLLAASAAAFASPIKVTAAEGITEYRLGNGLRVLLFPDQSKPTVTVNITYFVGSRHEGYGESGMAHLLEHMLFKGTPTHPDIWKTLQDRGASFNGTTWWDRTNYYEELPATPENLEFALGLEADRMTNSKVSAEDLAKEFSVVRNEFEMGESNPTGVLEEKMLAAAFQWHNYGKSTIGSRSDIERVPIESLRAFYRRFYRPDNALLVVAGKLDEVRTLALVERKFRGIPRPAQPLAPTWTVEPVQDGERTVVLRRAGDVQVVSLLYHGVAGPDPDWAAADAIADILADKPSGRLYKALVDKGLASEVYGAVYPTAEPGVLVLGAKVRLGGSVDRAREVMIRTVEGLARGEIGRDELERWRAKSLKNFELDMTETSRIGVALSDWAAMGDWRLFFLTRDRSKALRIDDVARFAKSYLKESNRTLGLFLPTKTPERAPAAPKPDVAAMMKDYKGAPAVAAGEVFVATPDTVEKRTGRVRLPEGLALALLPKKTKGGAVRLVLTLRFGSEKDLRGKVAAAALLPQMLLRGTKGRSYQQIKDELDRLKAEISFGGSGTPGVSQARVMTVRESLPTVLRLLGEVVREPAFAKQEFETLRKERLARLEEELQDPMANGFSAIMQKILPWPKNDVRYVPSLKESIEDTRRVSLVDIAALHKRLWGASAAQLAVVGDFDETEIRGIAARDLAPWASPRPYQRVARPFREGQVADLDIDTPDKEMAFVGVGHPLQARDDDPDHPALVMVNHLLGGSASSRLLQRLRQKDGLSYGAFSALHAHPIDRSGYFYAGAMCAPQNAGRAMAALLEEIDRLLKDGVGDRELADGKQSYAQTFLTHMAEDDFVAGELAQGLFLDRTFAYWKHLGGKIAKLTPADVTSAARKHLQPSKLAKVKAGDSKKR